MSRKPWARADWKKKREEIITPDSVCFQCGSKKGLTVHHPARKYSTSTKEYVSLNDTVFMCSKCHFLYHIKGLDLCPTCKKHYKKIGYPECYTCHKKTEEELESSLDSIAEQDMEDDEWFEKFCAASPEEKTIMLNENYEKAKKEEADMETVDGYEVYCEPPPDK